jgi:hypothetical protein
MGKEFPAAKAPHHIGDQLPTITAMQQEQSIHAGLARIAAFSSAISAEAERMFGLPVLARDSSEEMQAVVAELRSMSKILADSRSEILALAPPPLGGVKLNEAGGTLDDVVAETERATLEIMKQAEQIQAAAMRLSQISRDDVGAELAEVNQAATAITVACIFQDLTGQKIRKVMSTMREIETRVGALVGLMGIEGEELLALQALPAPLLNGPSTAAEGGLGQDAVDDLFG